MHAAQRIGHRFHKQGSQHGQSLLETALVIPVLAIIVVGALDLGRVFFSIITVTNVAREGSRYLTLHEDDVDATLEHNCYDLPSAPVRADTPYFCTLYAARQEAQATLWAPIVDPDQITLTPVCPDSNPGDGRCDRASVAQMQASYCFRPIMSWLIRNQSSICTGLGGIEIRRTAKMMVP